MDSSLIPLAYLVASVCFVLALQALSSPKRARQGNLLGAFGMLVAVVGTLLATEIVRIEWIIAGLIIGSLIGASMAVEGSIRRVS